MKENLKAVLNSRLYSNVEKQYGADLVLPLNYLTQYWI